MASRHRGKLFILKDGLYACYFKPAERVGANIRSRECRVHIDKFDYSVHSDAWPSAGRAFIVLSGRTDGKVFLFASTGVVCWLYAKQFEWVFGKKLSD